MNRIPAIQIKLELHGDPIFEGPRCWALASQALRDRSSSFPKGGCYDKIDFEITFEDGYTYGGRLECSHPSSEYPDLDMAAHVRDFCEFYGGLRRPNHMSEEDWQRAKDCFREDAPQYAAVLEKYEVPLSS